MTESMPWRCRREAPRISNLARTKEPRESFRMVETTMLRLVNGSISRGPSSRKNGPLLGHRPNEAKDRTMKSRRSGTLFSRGETWIERTVKRILSMRVLIAESDEAFLTIMQAYLQRFGHQVAISSDGLKCKAILRDFAPDVLVLDCELLWAEGVAAEMANNPVLQTVPAIHVSDQNPTEPSPTAIEFPVAAWLRKPFGLADLRDQIESVYRGVPAS